MVVMNLQKKAGCFSGFNLLKCALLFTRPHKAYSFDKSKSVSISTLVLDSSLYSLFINFRSQVYHEIKSINLFNKSLWRKWFISGLSFYFSLHFYYVLVTSNPRQTFSLSIYKYQAVSHSVAVWFTPPFSSVVKVKRKMYIVLFSIIA